MSIDVNTLAVKVQSEGVENLATGLNKIFKEAKKAEDRVDTLTQKISKLSNMFDTGAASAKAYQEAINLANRSVGGYDKASSELTATMKDLTKAETLVAESMGKVEAKASGSTTAIVINNRAMTEAHALARGLAGSLGALWLTYGNIAPMVAGVALGTAFKSVITIGAELENTLEGIRVKGQESFESIALMRNEISQLGQSVYGPREVAKAFEDLILAGLNAEQAVAGIRDSLNLAIVGGTSVEQASTTLVQVSTSLGLTAESFGHVGDVIAKTAAVSMSSVETLSEAFKSASVVGKLYGVTLVDIGTGLGALSQLGIQGSAAGTSLKNFYKELGSDAKNLKNAMHDLKMEPADLKDANGNFLDFVTVIEKVSKGLDTMTLGSQKLAIQHLSNERGMKMLVEALDLFRQKTEDGSTVLQKFKDQIADSLGYTAIGAAQMALTVENQFKAVKNTLQTSLAEAFTAISPQLSLIATAFREAFSSPEFKKGIQTISVMLSELGLLLANNLKSVILFGEAFLTWKVASVLIDTVKGLYAMKIAMDAAKLSAFALNAMFGVIAITIGLVVGLWALFNDHVDKASRQSAALNTLSNYDDQLKQQAKHLHEVNDQMTKGLSLKEADIIVTQNQGLALARMSKYGAVLAAQDQVDAAKKNVHPEDIGKFKYEVFKKTLDEAQTNLDKVKKQSDAYLKDVEFHLQQIQAESLATILNEEKAAAHPHVGGKGTLTEKDAGAGKRENDLYAAALLKIEAEIEAAKRQLKFVEDQNQSLFETGEIGKLTMIKRNSAEEIKLYQTAIDKYNDMINTAAPKDREAKKAGLNNKILAAEDNLSQATIKMHQQEAVYMAEIDKSMTENAIKEAEAKGQFVLAAQLKYGDLNQKEQTRTLNNIATAQTELDAATQAGGLDNIRILTAQIEKLKQYKEQMDKLAVAQTTAAQFKQDLFAFDAIFKTAQAGMEELNEKAAEGGGFFARLFSAEEVTKLKNDYIPQIQAEIEKLQADIMLPGASDMDIANAENKVRGYYKFLNKQNDTYKESLKAVDEFMIEGFQAAMSNVDGAWSAFVKKLKDTFKNNLIEEIYRMFARPFVMQIVANFAGAAGMPGMASATSTASGFAQGTSMLSMGKTLWDGFQNGMTSSTGGFISSLGNMVGSDSIANFGIGLQGGATGDATIAASQYAAEAEGASGAGAAGGGTAGASGTAAGQAGASAGAILNAVTPAIIGQFVGRAISGGYHIGNNSSNLAVNAGTIIGAIAGGPIGAGIGAAIGGAVNRLFGTKSREIQSQGIQGTFNSSGFSGQSFQNWIEKGGLFRSDKTGTVNSALSDNVTNQFSAGLKAVKDSTMSYAKTLGLTSSTIDGYTKDIHLALTNDDAQNQKLITDLFSSIGDDMANLYTGLSQFAVGNETSSATLQRLATEYAATDTVIEALGKTSQQAFGAVGVASISARESLIAFAGGLSNLQSMTAFFAQNFLTDAERMAPAMKDLNKSMSDLGYAGIVTKAQFKGIVEGLDLSSASGAKMYASLMQLAPAFNDVANYVTQLASDNLDKSLASLSRAVSAEKTALQTAYDAQVKAINDKKDLDTKAAQDQLAIAQTASSAIDSVFSTLSQSLSSLVEMTRTQAQGVLRSALSFANGGGDLSKVSNLSDALQAVAKPSQDLFSTFLDYQRDQVKTSNVVSQLKDKAGQQVDATKLTVDAINATIDSINSTSTAQLAALDTQHTEDVAKLDGILATAQSQVDLLKGIDDSIISVSQALGNFNNQPAIASTSAITNAYQTSLGRNPESTGLAYWQNQVSQGATTAQVTNSISNSREAQVDSLYQTLLNRAPDTAGLQYWVNSGLPLDQIKQAFLGSAEYKGTHSFAVGTNYIPYDMMAQVHKGERIVPAADNNELMARLRNPQASSEAMAIEIKNLRGCIEDLKNAVIQGMVSGNKDVYDITKIIRKWDGEGTPDVREVV